MMLGGGREQALLAAASPKSDEEGEFIDATTEGVSATDTAAVSQSLRNKTASLRFSETRTFPTQQTTSRYNIQIVGSSPSPPVILYTIKSLKGSEEVIVTRKYSDFQFLHEQLQHTHPTLVIPPLPGQTSFVKFDAKAMEPRLRDFTRFLQRIAAHPVLYSEESFVTFLQGASQDAPSASSPPQTEAVSTEEVLRVVGHSRLANLTKAPLTDTDPFFVEKKKFLDSLGPSIEHTITCSTTVQRKWKELQQCYSQFAVEMDAFAKSYQKQDEENAAVCTNVYQACATVSKLTTELVSALVPFFFFFTNLARLLNTLSL
eukprot:TRINITY_DN4144_c0_g1_i5.p1 TRINITY_DN4144_c0_g1~~TRINITY_DN4144_c0_g1_i5.p1  ORF type:complete len:317 (+),score=64.84 TRINITY_DN4144_c0_g1_i5:10-960(+)